MCRTINCDCTNPCTRRLHLSIIFLISFFNFSLEIHQIPTKFNQFLCEKKQSFLSKLYKAALVQLCPGSSAYLTMVTKSWPSLKSCPKACLKAEENDDLFSKLPEEILVSIMSSFTIDDAVRFSLVSRQCERAWRYFPVLIFKDYQPELKIWDRWETIAEDKDWFVRRVDRVLEKHLGATIDELRIIFDLEMSSQSYVDKWVTVALDKQVKRLELNFSAILRNMLVQDRRNLRPISICFDLPPKFTDSGFKSFLTSLCLRYVSVTNEFVDYLPLSCPLLEELCIQGSRNLTRLTGSLEWKHLEVSYCPNLRIIDVSARKLHSFTLYHVFPIELRIADAPSLFKLSIGHAKLIPHVFDSLSDILSQLVYLNLTVTRCLSVPVMSDLGNGVAMPKLRHLELTVMHGMMEICLYESISVFEACPNLEKLTLMFECFIEEEDKPDRELRNWVVDGFPLKCLKTLEILGYRGLAVDLEFAFFVLKNASMLEEIIVDFFLPNQRIVFGLLPLNDNDKRERVVKLQTKLPQGVKLTVK